MKLPKELTIATPLSKCLAMVVFLALPIIGFFTGMRYQEMLDLAKRQQEENNVSIVRVPTPTPLAIPTVDPSITANWKTYENQIFKYSFRHPPNWYSKDKLPEGPEYPGISVGFFLEGSEAEFDIGDQSGNELATAHAILDMSPVDYWKSEYYPDSQETIVGGKKALITNSNIVAIELSSDIRLNFYGINDRTLLDQILATFKFTTP